MQRVRLSEAISKAELHGRLRQWLEETNEPTIGPPGIDERNPWVHVEDNGYRYKFHADTKRSAVAEYLQLVDRYGDDIMWHVVENQHGNRNAVAFGPEAFRLKNRLYLYLIGKASRATAMAKPIYPDEVEPGEVFREGAKRTVIVNAYERDPRARDACIAAYGTKCFVCGLSFGARYGPVAEGIIHVHHLRPLSEIGEEYAVDPIKDLRPVCPNCHAVLHLRKPPCSIEEVKEFLQKASHDS